MARTVSVVRTVNLESGYPTVEQAVVRMNQALFSARASGTKVIKLIHGYGSSGKGGSIRLSVIRELQAKKSAGIIRELVPGDDFSPFSPAGRRLLTAVPELSRDPDYSRGNRGITLVLF